MLQWLPGSSSEVIWNDRLDDQFVCLHPRHQDRPETHHPAPVYAFSPDGKQAVAPDFRRINDTGQAMAIPACLIPTRTCWRPNRPASGTSTWTPAPAS